MEHPALLFGPGQAAAGTPVAACFDMLQLSWRVSGGHSRSRAYAALAVARSGHNETCLSFSWTDEGRAWSLVLTDAAACERLMATPPAGLATALAGIRQHARRAAGRRALGLSALGLWIALPLLLVIGLLFAAAPILSLAVSSVSVEREQKIGALLFEAQKARLDLIENTPATAAVEAIGRQLTKDSSYSYRWHVARDASINAFAMPGGYIVVNSGLIDAAATAEELAGVIAHEVQHVEQRHTLQQIARQLGTTLAIALVMGDSGALGRIAAELSGLRFSRVHEREADVRAVDSLRAAGIDPAGMVSMFRKLEAAAAGPRPPPMLSSHPATADRIAAIEVAIRAVPARPYGPLAVGWDAVQRSLAENRQGR